MGDFEDQISDSDKVRIASDFIKSAPPGEFNEVFNDVRILLNEDMLLKEKGSNAFADYDMEQFTPCRLDGENDLVLITTHGKISSNNFFDPKSKKSFRFDHLRKEASELEPSSGDEGSESWREAVDDAVRQYIKSHYFRGSLTVYGKSDGEDVTLTICIEDHEFQPQNFWNGRWRSQWSITFNKSNLGSAELKGVLRLQVHYYEDGNVQLVSEKEVTSDIVVSDPSTLGEKVAIIIENAESVYQRAIGENYEMMSATTFKALRRQLPITRTKIDWNKLVSYRVGQELKN